MMPMRFADMRPGCYDPTARLADMDEGHIERSLNFPNYPRFAGQLFSEAKDKDLALACVEAWNDWMIEEWCGDSGGRLIPLGIVPLWDPGLAGGRGAPQRRRAGRRRSRSPSCPPTSACPRSTTRTATGTRCSRRATRPAPSICMHIGSGSVLQRTSPDSPVGRDDRAHVAQRLHGDGRLAAVGDAAALPEPEDRLLREPGRVDAVPARSARPRVHEQWRVVRPGPGAHRAPVVAGARARVRLLLRRHGRHRRPPPDRHRAARLRDRLPASGLHVAAHAQAGRRDRGARARRRSSRCSYARTRSRCSTSSRATSDRSTCGPTCPSRTRSPRTERQAHDVLRHRHPQRHHRRRHRPRALPRRRRHRRRTHRGDRPHQGTRRHRSRRRRARGHARLHRRPHPHGRAGVLGRARHQLVLARRDHGGDGPLRLHARAGVARRARARGAQPRARRGHRTGRARRGHRLDLDQLRRVPRRARPHPEGHQLRGEHRPLGAADVRDGRACVRGRGHRRRSRRDEGRADATPCTPAPTGSPPRGRCITRRPTTVPSLHGSRRGTRSSSSSRCSGTWAPASSRS